MNRFVEPPSRRSAATEAKLGRSASRRTLDVRVPYPNRAVPKGRLRDPPPRNASREYQLTHARLLIKLIASTISSASA